ncbi:hypothetical protein KCP69_06275 [Salmonella enterica subsp. enterica]|nr:hypothetical protein KCP69_06275 [Salmonella enterica subsp. enterica]
MMTFVPTSSTPCYCRGGSFAGLPARRQPFVDFTRGSLTAVSRFCHLPRRGIVDQRRCHSWPQTRGSESRFIIV